MLDSRAMWGAGVVLDVDGDGTPERKRGHDPRLPVGSGAASVPGWPTRSPSRFDGVSPAIRPLGGRAVGARQRYDEPVGACAPMVRLAVRSGLSRHVATLAIPLAALGHRLAQPGSDRA